METEIWPNLLHAARAAAVPVVLANARLSEKSRARGERVGALIRPAAQTLACVLAQTEADAQRLRGFGSVRVLVCGNLKFDLSPHPKLLARGLEWRQRLARPVVLAAVTREGEEMPLLQCWTALDVPRPLLLLVPRHQQRCDAVAELAADFGFTLRRRSGWAAQPPDDALPADVWLGDSMGEMPLYYAAADVALLGGSFARLGGQNLIEAAACGCPLVMGPHTFNFARPPRWPGRRRRPRVADMARGWRRPALAAPGAQRMGAAASPSAPRIAGPPTAWRTGSRLLGQPAVHRQQVVRRQLPRRLAQPGAIESTS